MPTYTFKFHVTIDIPQLSQIGGQIVANLNNISVALDSLSDTLDQELTEIHEALATMSGPTQEEVDMVAQRVLSLKERIANIIP